MRNCALACCLLTPIGNLFIQYSNLYNTEQVAEIDRLRLEYKKTFLFLVYETMGRTKRTSNCLRYTAKLLRHVETHESSGSYSGFCLLQQLMGKMKCHKACIRCGCLLNLAYFVFRFFQNIVVLWFLLRGGRCMQQRYVALCYLDVMALLCVEAKGSCSRESWGEDAVLHIFQNCVLILAPSLMQCCI